MGAAHVWNPAEVAGEASGGGGGGAIPSSPLAVDTSLSLPEMSPRVVCVPPLGFLAFPSLVAISLASQGLVSEESEAFFLPILRLRLRAVLLRRRFGRADVFVARDSVLSGLGRAFLLVCYSVFLLFFLSRELEVALICFLSRELCKDLFAEWSKLDDSRFAVETVSGGITNLCEFLNISCGVVMSRMHRRFRVSVYVALIGEVCW